MTFIDSTIKCKAVTLLPEFDTDCTILPCGPGAMRWPAGSGGHIIDDC